MTRLADKRVGIIGTGATAVQCVPYLAKAAKELFVFQRTPSSVDVRANAPIDPGWFSSIATPGWQGRWLDNFTANQAGGTATEDLVKDGWTDLSRRIGQRIMALPKEQREVIVLRFLVGLTPREIAARMGRSEDAVNGLQHRGRRRLRREMDRAAA